MLTLLLAIVVFLPAVAAAEPAAQTAPTMQTRPVTGPRLGAIVRLTVDGDGGEPYWSFDGTKIVFQAKRGDYQFDQIYIMDADGSNQRMVGTGKGRSTCAYFLPDGKHFLYASTHDRKDNQPEPPSGYGRGGNYGWAFDAGLDIFVADLGGKILRKIVDGPGYDAEATVSPRGDKIVFTSDRDGDLELYSMNLDGTDLRRLTFEKGYDGGAFFSPDGSRIIYRGSRTDDYRALQVYVMNADGSGKRQLTHGAGNTTSFAPSWHPDGKRVVFCSNMKAPAENRGDFDLFLMAIDAPEGSSAAAPVKLTDFPGFDGFPVFSPDGRKLAFASNRDGKTVYQTSIFLADFLE